MKRGKEKVKRVGKTKNRGFKAGGLTGFRVAQRVGGF